MNFCLDNIQFLTTVHEHAITVGFVTEHIQSKQIVVREPHATFRALRAAREIKKQATSLKKCIYSTYYPLISTHLWLCCSNFFNPFFWLCCKYDKPKTYQYTYVSLFFAYFPYFEQKIDGTCPVYTVQLWDGPQVQNRIQQLATFSMRSVSYQRKRTSC
jgi:hypothetical protein